MYKYFKNLYDKKYWKNKIFILLDNISLEKLNFIIKSSIWIIKIIITFIINLNL